MTPYQQIWTIARLELGRVFFSKRSFWVYILAIFPSIIFLGHALEANLKKRNWGGDRVTAAEVLDKVQSGMTDEQVLALAGKPVSDTTRKRRVRRGDEDPEAEKQPEVRRYVMYFDGKRRVDLRFEDGKLVSRNARELMNFEDDRRVYATMFQFFYLRLGIFFGCLGIFINLFRGEMLDRSLHFWFLAPVKREVLLLGKYLAGLIAAAFIFGTGALLSFLSMVLPHDPNEVATYWQTIGPEHAFWYVAAAALGCVGYGSVFLAAGLLLRNPILPAIVMLIWESINGFLPDVMQNLSVLHYLQSICPVPVPLPNDMPAVLKMLLAPAAPSSVPVAVLGLLAVTALVLFAAMQSVKRLEINYGTE
jgi:ABC-type transport system involved in multi-copper enzyme maturation permease subunit